MPGARIRTLATAALLLGALPLAVAHGDEHHEASTETPDASQPDQGSPQSYWALSDHATLMYWHIGLEVLAWVVVLPVG